MPNKPIDGAETRDAADAVIDRTVREMMSAEPRTDLRQRVMRRIEQTRERPSLRAGWTYAALAAGAAAIVAAAILWPREVQREPATTAPIARQTPAPAGSQQTPTTPGNVPRIASAPPRTARGPVDQQIPRGTIQAANLPVGDDPSAAAELPPIGGVEPMGAIPPIAVAAVPDEPISTSELTMKPLTIDPIDVPPITPAFTSFR